MSVELPIHAAPYSVPIWAFFPDPGFWRLVVRHLLPGGSDLWSSDTGLVLTPTGPSKFRLVHATSRWLQ